MTLDMDDFTEYINEINQSKKLSNQTYIENKKVKFAEEILKRYANEYSTFPRVTHDLSPLEEWLILELYEIHQEIIDYQDSR